MPAGSEDQVSKSAFPSPLDVNGYLTLAYKDSPTARYDFNFLESSALAVPVGQQIASYPVKNDETTYLKMLLKITQN